MVSFLAEAEADQEGPHGLVCGLDGGGNPFASELNQGVAKDCADRPRRGPVRRSPHETYFDVGRAVVIVNPTGNDLSLVDNTDRNAGAEVIDAEMITDPTGNGAVMAEDEHTYLLSFW